MYGLYTILVIESDRILFFFVSMGNMVWWGKKNPLWNFIPLSGAYPCRTAQFCGIAGKPGLVLDLFIMGFIGVPFWKYR